MGAEKAAGASSRAQGSSGGTRIIGRKRVAVSPAPGSASRASPARRTLQNQRSRRLDMDDGAPSLLESLPQDVLVKALCKVNHSDLKQLLLVSKTVSGATSVARQLHFAFATPVPKAASDEEGEPGAPKQQRVARSRVQGKNLASIAVNLFASPELCFSCVTPAPKARCGDGACPGAPRQHKVARACIEGESLASIAVNLFASPELHFATVTRVPKHTCGDKVCPGAPKQYKVTRSRVCAESLASIAANLFSSPELHFASATPAPKTTCGEEGCPDAPRQYKVARSRVQGKNLASIAANLFTSPEAEMSDSFGPF